MVLPEAACVVSGLILMTGILHRVPRMGNLLRRFAYMYGVFQGIIGAAALLAILWAWPHPVFSAALFLAGLLLLGGLWVQYPRDRGGIFSARGFILSKAQVAIGFAVLLLGVLGLMGYF